MTDIKDSTPKPTHLTNVDQTPRNFFGIVYFDIIGRVVTEVGHHDKSIFESKREVADKAFIGAWCYALLKTQNIKGVWQCAVVFPDGTVKVLKEGQIAVSVPTTVGKWIDYNAIINLARKNEVLCPIRFAPDSRIPWKSSAVTLRLEEFADEDALVLWLKKQDPTRFTVFVANPNKSNLAPDKDVLFMLCAVVDS